jgi:hypothetical protein
MYTNKSKNNQKPKDCHLKKISCPQIVYCDCVIEKGQKEAEPCRDKLSRNVGKKLPLLLLVSLVAKNFIQVMLLNPLFYYIAEFSASQCVDLNHEGYCRLLTCVTDQCMKSQHAATVHCSSHYLSFRRGCTKLHDWPCSLLLVDVLHQVGHSPLHVPPLLLFLLSHMNYLSCTALSLNRTEKSTGNKAGGGRTSPSMPFDADYLISK